MKREKLSVSRPLTKNLRSNKSAVKYVADHVDLSGTSKAAYELKATDDEQAKNEARQFLKFHSSIEVGTAFAR